jgi:hypothetical protein
VDELLDRSEPEVGIWKSDTVINYKARLGTQKLVEVRHASIAAIPIHDRSALRSRPKIMNSGTEQANDKGASWPMPMPMPVWVHVHARHLATQVRPAPTPGNTATPIRQKRTVAHLCIHGSTVH